MCLCVCFVLQKPFLNSQGFKLRRYILCWAITFNRVISDAFTVEYTQWYMYSYMYMCSVQLHVHVHVVCLALA